MRVRIACVHVIDVLFCRWHLFREELLASADELLQVCLRSLPLGGDTAADTTSELSTVLLTVLYRWRCQYASRGYKQLDRIATFIQKKYGVDLDRFRDTPTPAASAELTRSRSDRQLELLRQQLDNCRADMSDALAQAESCFQLLLPELTDFIDSQTQQLEKEEVEEEEQIELVGSKEDEQADGNRGSGRGSCTVETKDGTGDYGSSVESGDDAGCGGSCAVESEDDPGHGTGGSDWRVHGLLAGSSCQIPVRVQPLIVRVSGDNQSVIDALRDSVSLIRKQYLPRVNRWIEKCEEFPDECREFANQAMAVRDCLQSTVDRYGLLSFVRQNAVDSDDEDTSDFVEVSPEMDLLKLPAPSTVAGEAAVSADTDDAIAPTSTPVCVNGFVSRESTNTTDSSADNDHDEFPAAEECLLNAARDSGRVSVSVFQSVGPSLAAVDADCQKAGVWRGCSAGGGGEDDPVPVSDHSLLVRVGRRADPVSHTCGALMPSGRLCPRADRFRCPLHGVIVARDAEGLPLDPGLRRTEWEKRVRGDEHGDWQNPQLLAALKKSTGVDLTVRRRARRGGHLPPGSSRASARARLATKLLGRRHTSASAANLRRFKALMRTS